MSILEKLQRISACFKNVMRGGIFTIIELSVIIVIVERIKSGVSKVRLFGGLVLLIALIAICIKLKVYGLVDFSCVCIILGFHYFFFRFYQKQKKEVLSRIFLKLFVLITQNLFEAFCAYNTLLCLFFCVFASQYPNKSSNDSHNPCSPYVPCIVS